MPLVIFYTGVILFDHQLRMKIKKLAFVPSFNDNITGNIYLSNLRTIFKFIIAVLACAISVGL